MTPIVLAVVFLSLFSLFSNAAVPSFPLKNSAKAGLRIPALGVGTGAYKYCPNGGYGGWPECMDEAAGCGEYTERTVISWLLLGGRRLDCANSYGNTKAVGRAIKLSNVPRAQIFITEKVGPPPGVSMGYADTLVQMDQLLRDLQTDYVDLLLVHEPVGDIPQSRDPYCRVGSPVYSDKDCRLSTWRAMVRIYEEGKVDTTRTHHTHYTHYSRGGHRGHWPPPINIRLTSNART
jgi:diketogulonate reductase-like aldo/keto reductase